MRARPCPPLRLTQGRRKLGYVRGVPVRFHRKAGGESTVEGVIVVLFYFVFFIMSLVTHEYAHAWAATQAGDHTARSLGRLTMNPLKHIDPMMSILLPIITLYSAGVAFGGPKPVPVNPLRFRNLRSDTIKVSAAGVLMNLLIAAVCLVPLRLGVYGAITGSGPKSIGFVVLGMTGLSNLLLAIFNLMPVPPLDGSRLLRAVLPLEYARVIDRIEPFGMMIIIGLVLIGGFRFVLLPILFFVWEGVFRMPRESLYLVVEGFRDATQALFG